MPSPERSCSTPPPDLSPHIVYKKTVSPAARLGLAAMGAGELAIFNETLLGLTVIALAVFADRVRAGNTNAIKRREVKNNV